MKTSLQRIRDLMLRFEEGLMAILLGAMILLAASQILLRNLFDSGLIWADPTLRIMVLWVALLGAIAATREDRHIRIDLLSHYLSNRGKSIVSALNNLFGALVCGVITWHAVRFVYLEWQVGSKLFASLPAWMGEAIIPIGFGAMSLRFLFNIPLQFMHRNDPC
ncbi:MAG: TRAP transporter small permease [Candidatus Thiodiazotropha sp. (ex Dulcina madagascariensis)]|nr:TRAP transporter small permease [Candidatus Thiodiazotropha sp. (ex Epidulcina cf. delphinae)]MCU7921767.1 TRAP transporter small permease [Candidatus Thiodiazotropha sp. (ex Dulcina madagascariensis)]MCU7925949.1 TRAP transporter small permease [Candidatus Thiodiazotropha sp. (ex Dulcina madagascariensis)]MCU7935215.1 TRAP transporter small permease [Candidatus Thiodiazotropha sp. (ex Dulcina madagascariensis)]